MSALLGKLRGLAGDSIHDPWNPEYARYTPTPSGTWGFQPIDHPWNQTKKFAVTLARLKYGPGNPQGGPIRHTFDVSPEYNKLGKLYNYWDVGPIARQLLGWKDKWTRFNEEPANYNYEITRYIGGVEPEALLALATIRVEVGDRLREVPVVSGRNAAPDPVQAAGNAAETDTRSFIFTDNLHNQRQNLACRAAGGSGAFFL